MQYYLSNAVTSGGILRHQHRRGERGAGPHRAVRQRGAQDLREHRAAGRQTGGAAVDTTWKTANIFQPSQERDTRSAPSTAW